MNNKVTQLIATVLSNPQDIQEIHPMGNEFYFIFRRKYFSLAKRTDPSPSKGKYIFYIYPRATGALKELANELMGSVDIENYPMAMYRDSDFPENAELWRNLYALLEEKQLGLDELFDDVLK